MSEGDKNCDEQTDEAREVEIDVIGMNASDAPRKRFVIDDVVNKTINVRNGDTIKLTLTTESGTHDWVWGDDDDPDLQYAATEEVDLQNPMTTLRFTADRVGEFPYYCSVGTHRRQGMEGRFIVEASR
jgi:plastocyanin